MDTRFWGPSGWRLLHMIAEGSNASKNRTFWEMLPYVLPCKFCRASLTDYYKVNPIPKQRQDYQQWLYTIHKLVNQKLREQGQTLPPDPSYEAVKTHYSQLLKVGCSKAEFPGWSFLFCIADNHPTSSPSKPMPDTPSTPPTSLVERNKYNLLTPSERKNALKQFWQSISDVLPFPEWTESWKRHAGSVTAAVKNRRAALAWLWKIRCGMDTDLNKIRTVNFHGLCKQIATHRSGCSKSTRARTCRRLPDAAGGGRRKTRKQR